jgi:hypothetical protein
MKFTFLTDGVSDQALIPILIWLLREVGVTADLQSQWADLRNLRFPPVGLAERIRIALDLFPCELLFVHRDAEREPPANRAAEINAAINEQGIDTQHLCVIPVRMQEAWLLFNEQAIRSAAGNPSGRVRLELPPARDAEKIPDPKELLHNLLREASELNARRRRRFSVSHASRMVAECIDDFSPLRQLPAFAELETNLEATVAENHWS